MAEEGAAPIDPHPLDAGGFILLRLIGFILIIIAFIMHQCNPLNRQQTATPNKSKTFKQKFFDNIIIFICMANLIFTVSLITRSTCIGCRPSRFCASYSYITAKMSGWMFFVHRAKLVKGIKPILPDIWFETILPSIPLGVWLIYMVGLTTSLLQESEVCVEYKNNFLSSSWSPSYCHGHVEEGVSVVFIIGLAIDLSMSIFLLLLFIKPLMDNFRMDVGQLNAKQIESEMRSKKIKLLKWSIFMTFINLVSTNWALIGSSILSHREQISRYYLGLDPAINTITSILMIAGNREWLYSKFCKICERTQTAKVRDIEGVGSNEQTSNDQPSTNSTPVPSNFVDQETEEKDEDDGITIVMSQDDEMSTVLSEEKENELFTIFKLSQVQCLRECIAVGLPDDFINHLFKRFAEKLQNLQIQSTPIEPPQTSKK